MFDPSPPSRSSLIILATRRLRARLVADGLARRGVAVEVATSLDRLVEAAAAGTPDAVLLVPERLDGETGIAAIRRLRTVSRVPCVVVASAEDTPAARVAALDAGADEVLHSGIPVPEAIARIRATLRRARAVAAADVATAQQPAAWRLTATGRRLSPPSGPAHRLTSAEYELVSMLAAAQGTAVDREAISRRVFRRPWRPDDRAVDSLVKRLRRKLPSDAIHSVRGVGYALTVAIAAAAPVENCALHAFGTAQRR